MRRKLLEIARVLQDIAESGGRDSAALSGPLGKAELLAEAKREFRASLLRETHFEDLPFHEPGWEILLDLYIAHVEGRRLHVTAIGLDGKIPVATLLRWLLLLQKSGLVSREPDPRDKRRVWVTLTEAGIQRVERCLTECARNTMRLPWEQDAKQKESVSGNGAAGED